MYILGISCHYHEASAAIIHDGRIIAAAAEERFSRKKHDADVPTQAISYCLRAAGIRPHELEYAVFYEKPFQKFERNLTVSAAYAPYSGSWFVESMRNSLTEKLWIKSTILQELESIEKSSVQHQISQAARVLPLVSPNATHKGTPAVGAPRLASPAHITPDRILFVPQHLSHAAASFYPSPFAHAAYLTLDAVGEWTTGSWGVAKGHKIYPTAELRFPHSVGLLYSAFTALLGFEVNDGEYKVMGMAGYGKPVYVQKIKNIFRQFPDGSIELDLSYFSFHQSTRSMYSDTFRREFAGCDRFDLAASIQTVTEDIIFTMMTHVARTTGESNLVYGGGVALNSVVNGLITKRTPFRHVFIYPAAGDDGAAVGAALYVYHHILGNRKRYPIRDMFLGEQYSSTSIKQFLIKNKIPYKKYTDKTVCQYIADQLIAGRVVGWFEGRAEFGPRALGHRTILADPRNPKMKDIVNGKIKFREEFRPFAPVVLSEYAARYFDITEQSLSPFMLGTFRTKAGARSIAAATTHVDGTSRIQTVSRTYPGRYRGVVKAFYRKTKRPILLNTSFNLKGEPIVNSPEDAYSTFMRSGIDILVLENFVILKPVP